MITMVFCVNKQEIIENSNYLGQDSILPVNIVLKFVPEFSFLLQCNGAL